MLLLFPACLAAASMVGDWGGTLQVGDQGLRLVVHVTEGDDGALSATMDSLDQGAMGIKVDTVELNGDQFRFTISQIRGSYEGTLAEDGSAIEGNWSQGPGSMPLRLDRMAKGEKLEAAKPRLFEDSSLARLKGKWLGTLTAGAQELRVILRVEQRDGGFFVAIDSPDQGAKGIPVSSIRLDESAITFESQAVAGSFTGDLNEAATEISGTWSQGGADLPLTLTKVDKIPEARRPQHPKKPYPYEEREVAFPGGEDGVTLAGTLTLPRSEPPFPAVLLVSGSGPQDRDETIMRHKPFLVLADHLTRHGIAVLRYDDRGTAKSTGVFATASTLDFANDAAAGLRFLRSREEVSSGAVGLIGHSEGAIVGALVGSQGREADYLVLLACPGVPGDQVMLSQLREHLELQGASPDLIDTREAAMRELYDLVGSDTPPAELRRAVRELAPRALARPNAPPKAVQALVQQVSTPWFRHFVSHDPTDALAKVEVPVLAVFGEKDKQVLAHLNVPPVRRALAGETKRIEVLESLNHLLQFCETGAVSEYAKIEETMSPRALRLISSWIREVAG